MDEVKQLFKAATDRYNKFQPHYEHVKQLVVAAHTKLCRDSQFTYYGDYGGRPLVPYNVFSGNGGVSRPVRAELYLESPEDFLDGLDSFLDILRAGPEGWGAEERELGNQVVYTSVMSVASCYDLWQRGSRKTPGTFFEVLMAALLQQMLPRAAFSKHIPLAALVEDTEVMVEGQLTSAITEAEDADAAGSVSTDLVVKSSPESDHGIAIPLKITTRERIVQPFAHQRILDSAFGQGAFRSLLVCISETQLDEKTRSVKQVCVPGTVKLFQKYLAPLSGLYYCDVPQRYAAADMQRVIPVRTVGEFFCDLALMLNR